MSKVNFLDLVTIVGKSPEKYEGKKTYVSTGAVDCDHIDVEQLEEFSYSERPSRANLVADVDDILFAKMCATKKALQLDSITAKYIYSTGFYAVRAKENVITPKLLLHLISSDFFLSQKDLNCSGATQKAITNAGLKNIFMNIPTFEKQSEIAVILDKVDNAIKLKQKQMLYLEELVKSKFLCCIFADKLKAIKEKYYDSI